MNCADPAVTMRKDQILSSGTARPKLDAVMIVRIAPKLRARLDQVRQHLRMSRSEFARRAMSAAADALLDGECVEISTPQR